MRHFIIIPQIDDAGPAWKGGTPEEQGYYILPIAKLRRKGAKGNEYYVYSNPTEFKAIEADSAASAAMASEIPAPYKIVHIHCRMENILEQDKLEFVQKESEYFTKPLDCNPCAVITGKPTEPKESPAAEASPQPTEPPVAEQPQQAN